MGRPLRNATALILALGAAAAQPAVAPVRHYGASPGEAVWATEASRRMCHLTHAVPVYGRVVFARAAGDGLKFRVESTRDAPVSGQARLRVEPPAWRHGVDEQPIAQIALAPGSVPLELEGTLARRLMAELEQGMTPTLYHPDWADGQRTVKVSVSSVRFRPALEEFLACTEQLWPLGVEAASNLAVGFGPGEAALSDAARARLEMIADYLIHDPRVQMARLTGYTDNSGARRDNYLLSQRRAVAVRDYLLKAGVPRNRLRVGFRGEAGPTASNATAAGRARNRRVEIRLLP